MKCLKPNQSEYELLEPDPSLIPSPPPLIQVNIAGTMHFWGLNIDTLTTVVLVVAVGLAVDYSSHIGHTFMVVTGTNTGMCLK